MKVYIPFTFVILLFPLHIFATPIQGVVKEIQTGNPLPHAPVRIYQNQRLMASLQTNSFGEFETQLAKGNYIVRIQLPDSTWIKTSKIVGDKKYWVIYHHSLSKQTRYHTRHTRTGLKKALSYESDPMEMRSVSIASPAISLSDIIVDEKPFSITPGPHTILPKAGLLTAGEINDFQKWNAWQELSKSEWATHQNTWKINPTKRYMVQIKNKYNQPIPDAIVKLIALDNQVLWIARTDNTGKAELWEGFNNLQQPSIAAKIDVYHATKIHSITQPITQQQGINTLVLSADCQTKSAVDIAFVVDATGSMGDEIQYLKEEMKDVIHQAASKNRMLDIQTGSVFYKDMGDDYLTRKQAFTKDVNVTQDFIKEQGAGGGGDFPEAVDAALAVAIRELEWREGAVAKIMFLVLDAPPHEEDEIVKRMHDLIKEAASKGIRIVPIASSGIDKSTEFLLRSMALATNGTYTFLTDHSGIGNKHLAPSTDSFKVEQLNNLMVRIIQQFTYLPPCAETSKKDSSAYTQDNPFNLYDVTENIKVFPNPATDYCMVQVPEYTEEMYLTDLNGKVLEMLAFQGMLELRLSMVQYPTGFYFIRCKRGEKWLVEKLVVRK